MGGEKRSVGGAGGEGEFCMMRISCSNFHALSVELVGPMISMGLPLGPVVCWRGGLGISATMVGGGRLSVRCSEPRGLLPSAKAPCALLPNAAGVVVTAVALSLSGPTKAGSSVTGPAVA